MNVVKKSIPMVLTWLAVLFGCSLLQESGAVPWKVFPTFDEYKPVLVDDIQEWLDTRNEDEEAPIPAEEAPILNAGRNAAYLRNFFNALDELKAGKRDRVRIVHFGDSMIWGDNMTWPLKESFQKEYGSAGRGIMPIVPTSPTVLKGITNATRAEDFNHDKLSHFYKRSHYYKLYPDTKDQFGFTGEGAKPRSTNSVAAYRIPADQTAATEARVFLHSNKFEDSPTRQYTLELTTEHGKEQKTITLASLTATSVRFEFPEARNISIRMAQYEKQAPYIDAVCLEGGQGIVYNTIVRMGVHLSWYGSIHRQFVQQALTELDPDLVIFQFGVNESASLDAVPPFKEEICEQQLHDWLTEFRQIRPTTSVLFIGPLERLKNIDGKLVTMPAILQARGIQQRQAAAFKMAFLDSWTLMGGAGHMLTMVQNGWAIDDYTHITYRGGNNLAKSAYELIDAAYKGHEASEAKAASLQLERDKNMAIQFNSKSYVFFFFIVILLSIAFRKVPGLRIVMLTAASYYFYMSWKLWPVTLLIFSTFLDYFCGLAIEKSRNKGKKGSLFLAISLSGNLGLLFFFKYFDFLAGLANTLLAKGGASYQIPLLHLLLPVGISFYTFQTLSYSLDIYRGNLKAERNFWKFALFVTFFPQLVAGPIVRAKEFIPALYQKTRHFVLTNVHVSNGLFFILTGLIKKMSADWLAVNIVDRVFTSPQMHSSLEALCGVYAYALQIYGDFSGYTDIAIGSAMILGFQLTDNFNRPYRSGSISEFWRRWHISLGSWFRDYLYIPLGGNRRHVYFNVFMVMFLCGLWHGAGISFMLWGIYHGLFMMIERFTGLDRKQSTGLKRFARQFITFHIVLFGWIIFRSDNMETFNGVLKAIGTSTWTYANISLPIIAFMVTFYAIHFSPLQWKDRARELWIRTNPVVRGLVAGLVTIGLYNIAVSNVKPFIYFQF